MNSYSMKTLLAGSSLAVIGLMTPAHAQEAPAGANDVADIVVTARRVEERLQDVPISITVFNQDELEHANISNAADLATITPSLSANNNFGSENSSFAIRGFVQDIGTQPSVGVYFNDVVALRGFSNGLVAGDGAGPGSFFDLQNVQVLKGPQGTLFGRNTTGGAILLVPQRPTDEFEGYVQAGIGNFDMRHAEGVLNVPLGDQAALRLGIVHEDREGYLNNTSGVGPRDFNDVNYTAYRAGLRVNLTPELENYTLINYVQSDTNGSSQKLVAAGVGLFPGFGGLGALAADQLDPSSPNFQGAGFYDFAQDVAGAQSVLNTWQIFNTTTYDISDSLTFKNIFSYGQLTQDLTSPIFGTNFFTAGGDPISFSITSPVGHTSHESTLTDEARLEGSAFDDRFVWQSGLYYETSHPIGVVGSFSPVLAHCEVPGVLSSCSAPNGDGTGGVNITTGATQSVSQGAYAQGTYALTDQLKFMLGYRYTWDRISNTAVQTTNILSGAGGLLGPASALCSNPAAGDNATVSDCRSIYSVSTEAPTWLVGLDYTPMDDLLLYAKYARGYRSGTISPNVVDPFTTADAERVESYEIGSKYAFGGDLRGIFNVSLFYNDFTDQQLQVGLYRFDIPAAPTAAPLNIGASELYGAELQASIQPIDGLTLAFDYTYLNTEITEVATDIDADGDGVPDSTAGPYTIAQAAHAGDPLVLTPENKFTLSAQYLLPLDASVGDVTLGLTFIHTDEVLSNSNNHPPVPGLNPQFEALAFLPATDILNLNAGWEAIMGSRVDVNFFATNVTEEEYYTYVPGISVVTGSETAAIGQPRMYGVNLTYHFGAN